MPISSRALIALVVILTLCLSVAAVAAKTQSARAGAGPGRGNAVASSTENAAWIYTGSFRDTTPASVTGSIRLSASRGQSMSQDRATVNAQFNWQGSTYRVSVTCPFPISGQDFPGHGPVQFMRPVLGTADLGTLDLPETTAHVGVYGRATISKDGKVIADNQPAVVLVTHAIHSSDQTLLSTPDSGRKEIGLIIPGPLNGQKFVKGFPNGYFYVYWPSSTVTLSGNTNPLPMPQTIPSGAGRGPATPMIGTESPRGTISISLTNTGIRKAIGETPTGLYDLRITNNSRSTKGLVISGFDLCCTRYTRFSQLLRPGQSQVFRWYFAPGKVQMRDFSGGMRTSTSWTRVRYAGHSSSIVFTEL